MKLPNSRTENIVVQEAKKELLIYDLVTNQAFCLNETSAIVYLACDGQTTFADLKRQTKFGDDLIFLALDELKSQNLIAANSFISPFNAISRREVIRQVGLASMVALPFITSVIAPQAVDAQSGSAACACPAYSGDCIPHIGVWNVGCFPNEQACLNAAVAAAVNVCCSKALQFAQFDPATNCCTAFCTGGG